MEFLREFFAFLRFRKKLWLAPVLLLFLLLGGLLVLVGGTPLAPLIYTLF